MLRKEVPYSKKERKVRMMYEKQYMQRALELAKRGYGKVNPNPCVGAVIVKENRIIGEGWHKRYGGPHAEINALESCKESVAGATIYVTLEPCCHYGKTPPCTEKIVQSGITKVIIGCSDPNPLVSGKGALYLKEHGIEVVTGVLEKECIKLNEIFFHFIQNKSPFVVMKYAMTLDGKIATATGESRWITGEGAREKVHGERNRCMAIMAGVGTVIKDDPVLSCRIEDGRNPIRIICDTRLRTPLDSNIVKTAKEITTIIATSCMENERINLFERHGCKVIVIAEKDGRLDIKQLMLRLGEEGVDSILLEGGGTLNYSMVKEQQVHLVQAYIAPKIFGGKDAKTPVEGDGISNINDCLQLKNTKVLSIGNDFLFEGEVIY